MGNTISLNNVIIGEIAKRRWHMTRELLRVLINYINTSIAEPWGKNKVVNVTMYSDGLHPNPNQDNEPPSDTRPFDLDQMMDDQADTVDEIYILDPQEWTRLIEWCCFLNTRDGAFDLLVPLINLLIQRFVTKAE